MLVMPLRVTMADVARRAGVHKSTVSLALRNHPSIPEVTGAPLRRLAQEMGYHPEPALSLIAAHRWNSTKVTAGMTIAYIMPREKGTGANPKHYVEGVKSRAEQRGCHVEIVSLADYPNAGAASRMLYNRGISGLILAPMPFPTNPLDLDFDWSKFCVVCCSLGSTQPLLHTVSYDVFYSARRVWHEMRARGYRRIGPALFSHQPPAVHDYDRLGAVLSEQAEVRPSERIPVLRCGFSDRKEFKQWFKKHQPDAVLAFHRGVLTWLNEEGIRAPRDVGCACLQLLEDSDVAGMLVPPGPVAELAVDFIINSLRDNERGLPKLPRTVQVETEWHEGRTLRPRPGAATAKA